MSLLTTAFVRASVAVSLISGTVLAQTPAGSGRQQQAPLAIPNPHYISIVLDIDVNRPAAEVWKRVGKFCDVGEWLQIACTITSGKDGELGAVRSAANEILVAKTEFSYTYSQPVREGRPYNLYHGTLEARPLTATTTKLIYSLMYDDSVFPDDAARQADVALRKTRFENALKNMKILSEGGTLPPASAGGRGRTATAVPTQVTGK